MKAWKAAIVSADNARIVSQSLPVLPGSHGGSTAAVARYARSHALTWWPLHKHRLATLGAPASTKQPAAAPQHQEGMHCGLHQPQGDKAVSKTSDAGCSCKSTMVLWERKFSHICGTVGKPSSCATSWCIGWISSKLPIWTVTNPSPTRTLTVHRI